MGRYSKFDPRSRRRHRNPTDQNRAARLRAARAGAGYERAVDAARHFGWNRPTYFAHENGSRGIGAGRLEAYAAAFRVDEDWLAYGSTENN